VIRRRHLATALAVIVLATLGGVHAEEAIPEPLLGAIATYETGLHGVVGMQRHFKTTIDAGIVKHYEESDSWLILKDGIFEQAHYYRIVRDGAELSATDLAERDRQTNEGWSAGKIFFKEPYDRRFAKDYRFEVVSSCADCPVGTIAIAFSSAKHDAQHGSGTLWIETSSEHVTKLTYAPYELPPHATSGTVTETSDQALPNLWYVTRIDETYRGHALILRGSGSFTGVFDHFARFASVADGLSAMRETAIGPKKS
jgi:hypothetical protein